jgi:hypothetical protein
MNTLSSTFLFKTIIKEYPKLREIFKANVIENYVIPDSYYNHYYKIFQNKKYPLTKYMLQMAKEGRIGLINFSDPANIKLKSIVLFPYFTCLSSHNSSGKRVVYANAMVKAGYKRNVRTQEIESLKIDEVSLFGYLYSAAIAYIISTKSLVLENNTGFVIECAEVYTMLLTRCISNKQYPIGSSMNEYTRLNFVTACYFLQSLIGYDVERAVNTAFKLRIVDKNIIRNECVLYNHEELVLSSFETYIHSLEKEFSYIRPGSMTIRAISYNFTQLYGAVAFFALEHFQSFINMIINSNLGTNIYRDIAIKKGIYTGIIDTIEQALLVASVG